MGQTTQGEEKPSTPMLLDHDEIGTLRAPGPCVLAPQCGSHRSTPRKVMPRHATLRHHTARREPVPHTHTLFDHTAAEVQLVFTGSTLPWLVKHAMEE